MEDAMKNTPPKASEVKDQFYERIISAETREDAIREIWRMVLERDEQWMAYAEELVDKMIGGMKP